MHLNSPVGGMRRIQAGKGTGLVASAAGSSARRKRTSTFEGQHPPELAGRVHRGDERAGKGYWMVPPTRGFTSATRPSSVRSAPFRVPFPHDRDRSHQDRDTANGRDADGSSTTSATPTTTNSQTGAVEKWVAGSRLPAKLLGGLGVWISGTAGGRARVGGFFFLGTCSKVKPGELPRAGAKRRATALIRGARRARARVAGTHTWCVAERQMLVGVGASTWKSRRARKTRPSRFKRSDADDDAFAAPTGQAHAPPGSRHTDESH